VTAHPKIARMTPDPTEQASTPIESQTGERSRKAPKSPKELERERLAAALRENLKRRKAQARERRQTAARTTGEAEEPAAE
jgi:hypothetical protein